jgi:hypothetical protein
LFDVPHLIFNAVKLTVDTQGRNPEQKILLCLTNRPPMTALVQNWEQLQRVREKLDKPRTLKFGQSPLQAAYLHLA